MNSYRLAVTLTLCLFATTSLRADAFNSGDVKVDGVHLCCGKCLTEAKKSLTGVEGISKIRVNKSAETVVFEATNHDSALKGLTALANAGFYGKPSIDGPKFKVDAKAKQNVVSLSGLHLCCGGCVSAAVDAVESVDGVEKATPNAKAGTIAVTGQAIPLTAIMKALHESGFHGSVE